VGVPYRRNAESPAYKVLERTLRPAIKSIGGKWIKAQGYGGLQSPHGGTTMRARRHGGEKTTLPFAKPGL